MLRRKSLNWREAVVVSRPFWWVSTSVPFIVGALLARPELSFLLFVGAIYFLIPYNLLMYGVNDIFDYESDIRNERKNGVAHGKVLSKTKHHSLWKWIGFVNAPFLLLLLITGTIGSSLFLVLIIFMAAAYSVPRLRFKEIPFVDSFTSAFHYSSPFLFGLLLFSSPTLWIAAFAGFYFWTVGNHAFGAIQDIGPDNDAGIKSIATVLGAGRTVIFCLVMYSLAIFAPVLEYGLYGLAAAAAIAPYMITIMDTYKYRSKKNAPQFKKAWRRFLVLNYIVGGISSLLLIYLYNR